MINKKKKQIPRCTTVGQKEKRQTLNGSQTDFYKTKQNKKHKHLTQIEHKIV